MIDLLSFYRDVLTTQMGSDVERVNLDLSDAVDQAARTTSPEQSLARIAAIEECRSRLRSNAAPPLAVMIPMADGAAATVERNPAVAQQAMEAPAGARRITVPQPRGVPTESLSTWL